MVPKKLKVFLAYSFLKEKRSEDKLSDEEVGEWFKNLLKQRPLRFDVRSGEKPEPEYIDKKLHKRMDEADATIGLFTRRYQAGTKWLPSLFVLAECAYALALYRDFPKLVVGFYEEGIDPKDLALVTISGRELVPFNRNRLEEQKGDFLTYLKDLPTKILYYPVGPRLPIGPIYKQQTLHKIFTIYRNGAVTVQNISQMVIISAERFYQELQGKIPHEIWSEGPDFPPFNQMLDVLIEDRRLGKAFLVGTFMKRNNTLYETALAFDLKQQQRKTISFGAYFLDHNSKEVTIKNNDILYYQYAWGLPSAYPRTEEELEKSEKFVEMSGEKYCQGSVTSRHGPIGRLTLEMRFERQVKGKAIGIIFSKGPFFQVTPSTREPAPYWSEAKLLPKAEEENHTQWFETYKWQQDDFSGQARVLWRPCSDKHLI
jgi:hypothetical protein